MAVYTQDLQLNRAQLEAAHHDLFTTVQRQQEQLTYVERLHASASRTGSIEPGTPTVHCYPVLDFNTASSHT